MVKKNFRVLAFVLIFEFLQYHVWLFGLEFCDFWHSLDIFSCTASIWNLCVISIDRYIAVRDPLTYPGVMSVKRCSIAVALVWVGSTVISFPAIAWWRHESPDLYKNNCKCEFVDDFSYLCFSSLVSFYIPLFIMLFAYLKVYQAAAEYEQSLKSGIKTTKSSGGGGSSAVNLRMHRGGGGGGKGGGGKGCGKGGGKSSAGSSSGAKEKAAAVVAVAAVTPVHGKTSRQFTSGSGSPDCQALANNRQYSAASLSSGEKNQSSAIPDIVQAYDSPILERQRSALNLMENGQNPDSFTLVLSPLLAKKNARKGLQRTLAKFAKEKKAAKTLGIVVGFFAICWVPFFILNVLNGICPHCVKNRETLFTIFTWLGHCNSFLNPLIYSKTSKICPFAIIPLCKYAPLQIQ